MNDVIIIGAGPGGVSLSLYLKRSNINILVFDNNQSSLKKAKVVENYYGFKTISGEELYNNGIEQLNSLNVQLKEEEVIKIEKEENFKVYTLNGVYEAKTAVLATGIKRSKPIISNIKKYEGKGVSYCATCDGFFYRNKKLGVVGYKHLAYDEIKYLKNITDDITLFTNGEELEMDFSDLNIKINKGNIDKILGESSLEAISVDNTIIELDGLFIANSLNATAFSKTLGLELENNFIKVNNEYMTQLDGLYAIGDLVGNPMQIGKAVSDGIVLSSILIKKLRSKNE